MLKDMRSGKYKTIAAYSKIAQFKISNGIEAIVFW
jgi:hypothetical protein